MMQGIGEALEYAFKAMIGIFVILVVSLLYFAYVYFAYDRVEYKKVGSINYVTIKGKNYILKEIRIKTQEEVEELPLEVEE